MNFNNYIPDNLDIFEDYQARREAEYESWARTHTHEDCEYAVIDEETGAVFCTHGGCMGFVPRHETVDRSGCEDASW